MEANSEDAMGLIVFDLSAYLAVVRIHNVERPCHERSEPNNEGRVKERDGRRRRYWL